MTQLSPRRKIRIQLEDWEGDDVFPNLVSVPAYWTLTTFETFIGLCGIAYLAYIMAVVE